MGGIQPVDLPETNLIIGENWPHYDETAYAREADSQRVYAEQSGTASQAALAAADYTKPSFQGAAGTELTQRLTDRHHAHTEDETRHHNVAGWLDLANQNITWAKNTMNTATTDYHRSYEDAARRAIEETWTQQQLRDVKAILVQQAQNKVASTRSAFDDNHAAIAAGIASGAPPVAPKSLPAAAITHPPGTVVEA